MQNRDIPVIPVSEQKRHLLVILRFAIGSTDIYIGEIGGVDKQVDTQRRVRKGIILDIPAIKVLLPTGL